MAILLVVLLITASVRQAAACTPQAADSTTYRMDSIVVEATREGRTASTTPAAVGVLHQTETGRLRPGVSVEEALRELPGLFVNNRYNFSQEERISIRGLGSRAQFGVRSVRLVLDGIPLTFADGQAQLNTVDMSSIGRIEVLRGPSSSLYGNAAGGVVVLHTASLPDTTLTAVPGITIGGYGLQRYHLSAGGTQGRWSGRIAASTMMYNGFRDFSSAALYNASSLLRYAVGDSSTLSLALHLHSTPYAFNPGGMNRSELEADPTAVRTLVRRSGAGKQVRQGQSGLRFSGPLGTHDHLDLSIFGIVRTLDNPIVGRVIDLDRTAAGIRSVYRRDVLLPEALLRTSIGLDAEVQNDLRREYTNDGLTDEQTAMLSGRALLEAVRRGALLTDHEEQISTAGLFAHTSYMTTRWLLSLGGRYDTYTFAVEDALSPHASGQLTFGRFSPSLGAIYYLSPALHLYGTIATAFQTPTANELGNTPSGEGFNTDLRPETVRSAEIGLRYFGDGISAEAVLFGFLADNQIIPYQTADNSDVTYYRNAGQTRNTGAELLVALTPTAGLRLRAHYTLMHYVFTDYTIPAGDTRVQVAGNTVPGVPQHRVVATAAYLHESGISGEISAQWTDSYAANDGNGAPPGGTAPHTHYYTDAYTTVDVRFGYTASFEPFSVHIYGGIDNAFDTRYIASVIPNAAGDRFFEPAPRRTIYAGITLPIALGETP